MNTRIFATALDSDNVGSRSVHAAGLVSSIIVSSEGLCSARVSHPFHSRMLLESDNQTYLLWIGLHQNDEYRRRRP